LDLGDNCATLRGRPLCCDDRSALACETQRYRLSDATTRTSDNRNFVLKASIH
jgi:hypothetical protein